MKGASNKADAPNPVMTPLAPGLCSAALAVIHYAHHSIARNYGWLANRVVGG